MRVFLNGNDELMVETNVIPIKDLKDIAKAFLDNNGDKSCDYCNGVHDAYSSDNPSEAIISLSNDKETSYEMYKAVQDIMTSAYYELRETYATDILGKSLNTLTDADLKDLKKAYPFILSEAELK